MCTWEELEQGLQQKYGLIEKDETRLSVGFSWDDGRSQPATLQMVNFAGQNVVLITSPVVQYSREAADFLLQNLGMAVKRTDDGYLSIFHSMHIDGMQTTDCITAVSALAESADEIENQITGGGDSGIFTNTFDSHEVKTDAQEQEILGSGQYVVGSDVQPGLYRFAGYVARLDANMEIITNESVSSGLGLVAVSKHDSYLEISGEAISVADYPVYDVLANLPRGGIYIVGTDIPPGRYRINGDGRSAYYATYDKNMNRLNNDLNSGSLILNLGASVFAIEYSGRLERL